MPRLQPCGETTAIRGNVLDAGKWGTSGRTVPSIAPTRGVNTSCWKASASWSLSCVSLAEEVKQHSQKTSRGAPLIRFIALELRWPGPKADRCHRIYSHEGGWPGQSQRRSHTASSRTERQLTSGVESPSVDRGRRRPYGATRPRLSKQVLQATYEEATSPGGEGCKARCGARCSARRTRVGCGQRS